jgi:hypothetical protein
MALSNQPSQIKKYVCVECIGDPILRDEIGSLNRRWTCTYCKKRQLAVSIESLAERVDEVYMLVVGFGEEYPTADPDSDNAIWKNDGVAPPEIIQELIECDSSETAADIAAELSEKEAYGVVKDGDTAWYDDTSEIYTIKIPRDPTFLETWSSFKQTVKHSRRFFNDEATALLTRILAPIITGEWPPGQSAVRTINPKDPDHFIYRGRQANDRASQLVIHSSPIRQLSAPPPHLNLAGRMNAAGIGALYGSFDRKTCIAELRSPVGSEAVIGKFEILRPIRVLDLTILENASASFSFFQSDFLEKYAYGRFVEGFHAEIRKPVIPGRETLEYLPTQFVCEYLWTQAEPKFDGLIDGSSQLSNGANNIVLFPHAIDVEGYHEETADRTAELSSSYDEQHEDVVTFDEPDGKASAAAIEIPIATLRLLVNEIVISQVKAIDYNCEERRVYRLRMPRTSIDL